MIASIARIRGTNRRILQATSTVDRPEEVCLAWAVSRSGPRSEEQEHQTLDACWHLSGGMVYSCISCISVEYNAPQSLSVGPLPLPHHAVNPQIKLMGPQPLLQGEIEE